MLGRLPLLLEFFLNGFFILIYTFKKSGNFQHLIEKLPVQDIFSFALFVVPAVLFLSVATNFLKSESFEDFIRKYIFSVIIFVPMLITWGDLEFLYWLSAVHLFSSVISVYEKKEQRVSFNKEITSSFFFRLKLQPAQVVLISFGIWIGLGTLLLALPVSMNSGKSMGFVDAFFMATTSSCVTGLTTLSPADDLSFFGQMVMLILIQVGGLGIMTLSSSMAVIMGKSLQMREQVIMQDVLDTSNSEELLSLIIDIIRYTFTVEFIGAVILTVAFYQEGYEIGQSMYLGFYHSISAFCNAGIALFTNSLDEFRHSETILYTVMFLVTLGGIGFSVMKDVTNAVKNRTSIRELSLHTKIVLTTHFSLLIVTTLYLFFSEFLNAFQDMGIWERFNISLFHAVIIRTAGFGMMDLNTLHPHSLYLLIIVMFIGASPGSTGGGIKTTTMAVLLQSITATLRGKNHVEFFERRIPQQVVVKAIAIFIISLIICSSSILIMMRLEPDKNFLDIFFECVSAFATVGSSLGITPLLSSAGKICISLLMFVGRVGPLTLVLAISSRAVLPKKVEYPEGKILIG
jgi:trk system potassium uptake protein TrkH